MAGFGEPLMVNYNFLQWGIGNNAACLDNYRSVVSGGKPTYTTGDRVLQWASSLAQDSHHGFPSGFSRFRAFLFNGFVKGLHDRFEIGLFYELVKCSRSGDCSMNL